MGTFNIQIPNVRQLDWSDPVVQKRMLNWMNELTEKLNYTLNNLDYDNMSDETSLNITGMASSLSENKQATDENIKALNRKLIARQLSPTAGTNIEVTRNASSKSGNVAEVTVSLTATGSVAGESVILSDLPKSMSTEQYQRFFLGWNTATSSVIRLYFRGDTGQIGTKENLSEDDVIRFTYVYITQ